MDSKTFLAYTFDQGPPMRLVPANRDRGWMDATARHFAYRCLPMVIANQAGWFVLNSHRVCVVWTGGAGADSVQVWHLSGEPPWPAISNFGHGIVTFAVPFLFRTPPGYNILMRGPANWPKDGAYPLEGVIETDWATATANMNWQITRPNTPIVFDVDEPICMVVPQPRGLLESLEPRLQPLIENEPLSESHEHWAASRADFLAEMKVPNSDAAKVGWQKHYFQGITSDGQAAVEHETRLKLRPFNEGVE
jgi:hypothetical protein